MKEQNHTKITSKCAIGFVKNLIKNENSDLIVSNVIKKNDDIIASFTNGKEIKIGGYWAFLISKMQETNEEGF